MLRHRDPMGHVKPDVKRDVAATGPEREVGGARVRGNLRGSSVSIDEGARYSGRLECEFELPPELGGSSRGESRGRPAARH